MTNDATEDRRGTMSNPAGFMTVTAHECLGHRAGAVVEPQAPTEVSRQMLSSWPRPGRPGRRHRAGVEYGGVLLELLPVQYRFRKFPSSLTKVRMKSCTASATRIDGSFLGSTIEHTV